MRGHRTFLVSLVAMGAVVLGSPVPAAGSPFLTEWIVNDVVTGVQSSPDLVALPNGSFAAVWHDSRNQVIGLRDYDIFVSLLDPHLRRSYRNQRVNDDTAGPDQTYPAAASTATGTLRVAWVDQRDGVSAIYMASGDGLSFSPNLRVNVSAFPQVHPALAVDSMGNPHVAWTDFRGGDPDVYYASSRDGGRSFPSAVRVDGDAGSASQQNPKIAVGPGGDVWIAWTEYRNDADGRWMDFGGADGLNDADVFLRCLCGGSWTPEIRVNKDSGRALQAVGGLDVSSSAVLATWVDFRNDLDGYPILWPPEGGSDGVNNGDIFLTATFDNAATFAPDLLVSTDEQPQPQEFAALAATNDEAHVVWASAQSGGWALHHVVAQLPSLQLRASSPAVGGIAGSYQLYPSVAVGSEVGVAWSDSRSDAEMDIFATIGIDDPPVAIGSASATYGFIGEVIVFDGRQSTDDLGVVSYKWDFGDGFSEFGAIVSHSFLSRGAFAVTLEVRDSRGQNDTHTIPITIVNRPPVCVITATDSAIEPGTIVWFNGSTSTDLDGVVMEYIFDFGDGATAVGASALAGHAYAEPGENLVTLTVTDDSGDKSSCRVAVTVREAGPPPLRPSTPWFLFASLVAVVLLILLLWFSRNQRRG